MGRIKSALIKRTARTIVKENNDLTISFEKNKEAIKKYTLPDKGTRNKIAGYIVRIKRAGNIPKPRKIAEKNE